MTLTTMSMLQDSAAAMIRSNTVSVQQVVAVILIVFCSSTTYIAQADLTLSPSDVTINVTDTAQFNVSAARSTELLRLSGDKASSTGTDFFQLTTFADDATRGGNSGKMSSPSPINQMAASTTAAHSVPIAIYRNITGTISSQKYRNGRITSTSRRPAVTAAGILADDVIDKQGESHDDTGNRSTFTQLDDVIVDDVTQEKDNRQQEDSFWSAEVEKVVERQQAGANASSSSTAGHDSPQQTLTIIDTADYAAQQTSDDDEQDYNTQTDSNDYPLDVAGEERALPDYRVGNEFHAYALPLSQQLAELGIHDLRGRAISLRWLDEHTGHKHPRLHISRLTFIAIVLVVISAGVLLIMFAVKYRHVGTTLAQYIRSQLATRRGRWRRTTAADESNTLLANAQV